MAQFELTFLGTGTSLGVPVIGCRCPVCCSPDSRDQRDRCSLYIRTPECCLVVDTGPDFRRQFLRNRICQLDAVLITHAHTDHIMGFDDLRPFTFEESDYMPVYASPATMDGLRRAFHFAFDVHNRFPGYLRPEPREISGSFELGNTTITPLPVQHGKVVVTGYRFDRTGMPGVVYLPDCKLIPDTTRDLMMDCGILIIDALRYRPHHTHLNVEEATAVARDVRARQTFFTHLCHEISHAGLEENLPPDIRVAFDGLQLRLE